MKPRTQVKRVGGQKKTLTPTAEIMYTIVRNPRSGEQINRSASAFFGGEATGTILLTPNERRVAEDRRDCYWLYVITNCNTEPKLQEPIKDPTRLEWQEVKKVSHYSLSVDVAKKG